MKLLLKAVFVAIMVLMFAIPAFAEGPRITTGSSSGTYFKVGLNMKSMLGGAEVMKSKGSVENINRIMKGEADIGIVQMDAYAFEAAKNPEVESVVEVIGPLYKECVYVAARKDGKVQDEDDLQSKGVTIAVGKQGSGSTVTWDYMRQLEPGYKNSAVQFKGGIRALGKLAAGGKNAPDAVMWVARPDLSKKLPATVLKNKDLVFIDLNDKDLNDKYEVTGDPIYEFMDIKSTGGFFAGNVETICVDAVVVANTDADEEMLEKLSDIVLNYKQSLLK